MNTFLKGIRPMMYIIGVFLTLSLGIYYVSENDLLPKAAPAPITGTLSLFGLSEGADVSINGNAVSGSSFELSPGEYAVSVSAQGHYDRSFPVIVEAGKTTSLQVELEKVAPKSAHPLWIVFALVAFVLALFAGMFMGMSGRQVSYK